jgi:DNA invertase Pin-like site-specific DNA recombinase
MTGYRRQAQRDQRMAIGREARKLIDAGMTTQQAADRLRVSRSQLYRAWTDLAATERDPLLS